MKPIALLTVAFCSLCLPAPAAQTYSARGLVLRVDKPHSSLLISCEEIAHFMQAMVMPFTVKDPKEIQEITTGTMIEFTLVVQREASYIESIRVRQYEGGEQDPLAAQRLKLIAAFSDPTTPPPQQQQLGQGVPDFKLIDQARREVSLSQFSGKTVVLTFTYTHCVLPNFCFRNSNNLRLLQKRFADRMGRDLVLMTVTFDPVHDTPEVLAKAAKTWNAVPGRWEFLTGAPEAVSALAGRFGMTYWSDEGLMNHALHTVVIDGQGKLAANLEGNQYTADELGDLVEFVLNQSQMPLRSARGQ
jgi:protein SCO1